MSKTSWKETIVDAAMVGIFCAMLSCSFDALGHAHRNKPTALTPAANLTDSKQAAYIAPVHPHGELTLVGQIETGAQPPQAVFLCPSFGYAPFMVSFGGTPQGVPVSCFIGRPTPQNLPPYLVVGSKLITNQETGKNHA